jgi:hypothetical protein
MLFQNMASPHDYISLKNRCQVKTRLPEEKNVHYGVEILRLLGEYTARHWEHPYLSNNLKNRYSNLLQNVALYDYIYHTGDNTISLRFQCGHRIQFRRIFLTTVLALVTGQDTIARHNRIALKDLIENLPTLDT